MQRQNKGSQNVSRDLIILEGSLQLIHTFWLQTFPRQSRQNRQLRTRADDATSTEDEKFAIYTRISGSEPVKTNNTSFDQH